MIVNVDNLPSATSLFIVRSSKEKYMKRFSLAGIYQITRSLIPNLSPITYSETIVYTDDIPENEIDSHLNPKEMVSKEEIARYFIEEIRKMKPG